MNNEIKIVSGGVKTGVTGTVTGTVIETVTETETATDAEGMFALFNVLLYDVNDMLFTNPEEYI